MKKVMVVLLAGILTLGLSGMALAFHDGGVARCEGCHTMHNSLNGSQMTGAFGQYTTGSYLLQGSDQSSTCLNCHQNAADTGPSSYHISTADTGLGAGLSPLQRTPGGDFGWLKKTYSWTSRGSTKTSAGERHGHNIVAGDYGYVADATLNTAPGGTYPAASLTCASCHDPHGKYRVFADGSVDTTGLPIENHGSYNTDADPVDGSFAVGAYRILGGVGYEPKSVVGQGLQFPNTVPAAIAPSSYNRTEASTQTRVAYGSGMSEWCANCHGQLHNDDYPTTLRHPAGNNAKLGATIAANYNAYVKTGDLTGLQASSFNSLVPFETGDVNDTAGRTAMKALANNDGSNLAGADATANVMCLSCHRAHASGFDSMLRWDNGETFITENGAYFASQGRTVAEWEDAYYDRPATAFGTYQRSLCNKCHVKD